VYAAELEGRIVVLEVHADALTAVGLWVERVGLFELFEGRRPVPLLRANNAEAVMPERGRGLCEGSMRSESHSQDKDRK
jgi:hypothetical protein